MAFDYKKEYKEFYLSKQVPSIVDVPVMNFIAVRGKFHLSESLNSNNNLRECDKNVYCTL